MTLKFYQYGSARLVATLELDEAHSSIIDKLNEPTRLSATLTSDTAPTLQLGARTTYKGVTYYTTKEPTVRKEHSKLYTIEAELETVIGLARHVILDNPVDKRSSFDYTATATEHIQLVVDSLNGKKLRKIPAWTRGTIRVPDKVKHIKYDGISAWDALQLIRQIYETDLHIDGTAIDLGIWSDKNNAIELAYGKGNGILSGLERIKHDDTPTPMSLYVTGTKRNMPKGRLTMQTLETLKVDNNGTIYHESKPDIEGRLYGTDKTGQYISEFTHDNGEQPLYTEATYTNEEIYPSHVSTIRSVTKVKDHYEVNSDFDYSKLLIEGEAMQVVFQSGNLAGREFDAKYFTSSGRLAIVPKEEDDTTLPNDTLCPKVGDQYIVTGIKLPDKYIREAQRKLTEEALRHLLKLQQQRYSYKAEIDPVYLHNNKTTIGNKLDVGQYVHLTDQQIAVGDPYIRIVGKRTYLDRPHTPEIELSNEVERLSLFERLIRDTSGVIADSKLIHGRITASSAALDNLTLTSTDLSERLKTAEESVQSHGKTLGSQAQVLASQAQLLADQGRQLTTQGESLSSQSQRLATAEQELGKKLGSREFAQWRDGDYSQRQSEIADELASKQPAGSYVVPSQLATSQQQAVAEAVKRAGEMDKEIKVGGRNLFRKEYFIGEVASRYNIPFDALQPRDGDNTYTLSLDYKISPEDKALSPRISCLYSNNGGWLVDDSDIKRDGEWHHKEYTIQIKQTDPSKYPIYGWFTDYSSRNGRTIDMVAVRNIKLERGTVATDWTPAPEDVAESVSKVNTSLVSLASTLLDPDKGEIHKLTSLLESHKTATDKSFAELSDHPLTIDDNGYWRIWSVKDSQYLTTQYPSRGEAGHTPELHIGEDDYLYIDGVQQRYIRGRQGEPGHNPSPDEVLSTDSFRKQLTSKVTSEVTTQVAPVNQRLESIDDKAEEARTIGSNAQRTANDMTDQVRLAMNGVTDLKNFRTSATSQLSDLDKRSFTFDQKRDLGYLTNSLQVLRSANDTLEGLALQRLIALSGDNQTVSAYLASKPMDAVLKAGITDFGKPTEREQVAINHNGTGHFGNLYFAGNQIDFRTSWDTAPYLSIGAEEATFIETFLAQARIVDTPVSVGSLDLTVSNAGYQRTLSVDNDGTRLTVTLDKIVVDVYGNSKLRLSLDGETLAEWVGSSRYIDTSGRTTDGGSSFRIERTPYKASNLTYERVVRAGNHTVRLEVVNPYNTCRATVNGLRVGRRYDTDAQQSALTKSGLRLFASPDRYFDVDYRKLVPPARPALTAAWINNPYLVRIVGGAKVDKLTADELDAPGVPLCGASFNEKGGQVKAFGKYVNRRGSSRALAVYDNGMAAFKVYHSIGHTNYIPIVQVSGWASNDINWSLTPRVYNITSEYFVVRILTNNDNPSRKAISYVAYKTM